MKKLWVTRLVTFLLAAYVLVLTLAPCVDNSTASCSKQQVIAGQAATDGHTDHHDACSPFCTCSCCNVAMEVAFPYFITVENLRAQKLIFTFTPHFISCFSHTIWEPPKLS